jgi:hypothetical protein
MPKQNGANRIGDSHAEAQFFIQELRARRSRHWENMKDYASISDTVQTLEKGLLNLTFDLTCKYAERCS